MATAAIFFILIGLVALAVGCLIGAVILRLSTRAVAGFWPSYKTVIGAIIVNIILGFAWGFVFGMFVAPSLIPVIGAKVQIMSAIVSGLLQAAILGVMIKDPESEPIGFGKGFLVSILPAVVLGALGGALYLAMPEEGKIAFMTGFRSSMEGSAYRWDRFATVQPALTPKPVLKTAADVTVEASQKEAMRLYPALGVAGSAFNKEFLKRHRLYQQEQPEYFQDPTWPLRLAEETKNTLLPTQVPGDGRVNVRH